MSKEQRRRDADAQRDHEIPQQREADDDAGDDDGRGHDQLDEFRARHLIPRHGIGGGHTKDQGHKRAEDRQKHRHAETGAETFDLEHLDEPLQA